MSQFISSGRGYIHDFVGWVKKWGVSTLLTPKQVAEMLSISVRTVYDHSIRLGGFYPAGIKALWFRRDVIEAIMEGHSFTINRPGRAIPSKVRSKKGFKSDPTADPIRHGLRSIGDAIPNLKNK